MKTLLTLSLAAVLAGCTAMGGERGGMHGQMGHGGMGGMEGKGDMQAMMQKRMQSMDTNGDGMLSKDEFMKAHETMFDSMPKNAQGLVDIKQMHGGMRR